MKNKEKMISNAEHNQAESELHEREDQLQLLLDITHKIHAAPDFYAALKIVLSCICTKMGWTYGEVWVPDEDKIRLEIAPVGCELDTEALVKFRQMTEKVTFRYGEGLPGRIWHSKQPEWIYDVSQADETLFLRNEWVVDAGLKSCVGVPLIADDTVLAILVFFLPESRYRDQRMVELVSAVTTQLGQLVQRKQMEAQLREYTEHLEQMVTAKVREVETEHARALAAARMAALGEMATEVAHELNQPLSSILFEADYLIKLSEQVLAQQKAAMISPDELRQIGHNLKKDVTRCRRMTDYLRTFGKVQDGHMAEVDLNQVLMNSFVLLAERLRVHEVEVQKKLDSDLPEVLADPYKLEHVFLNLLSNADQALEEMARRLREGIVTRPDYEKVLAVSTAQVEDFVLVTVRDNGCGISSRDLPHIFDPFFVTRSQKQGLGVGLATGYELVREMGGELMVKSAENEGTTFTVRFPMPPLPT